MTAGARMRNTAWANGLDTRHSRFRAWLDAQIVDHAFLRVFWTNFARVDDGVWRANQPSPATVRAWAGRGIRTVVNLRGEIQGGAYALEADACRRAGLTLINHRMVSRAPPTVEQVLGLKAIFETAERPLVFHCKSGADRSGIAAALYVLMMKGGTPAQAQSHLSLRHLHISLSRAGALDHFIETYRDHDATTPAPFLDWLTRDYDREAMRVEFRPFVPAELLSRLLRRE
ncbi:MAG: sulfur transferase domain-containing protein [Pseudomonadota bacterium]